MEEKIYNEIVMTALGSDLFFHFVKAAKNSDIRATQENFDWFCESILKR